MIIAKVSVEKIVEEPYVLNGSVNLMGHLLQLGFLYEWYTCEQYKWNEDIYHIGKYTYLSIGCNPHGKRYLTDEEEKILLMQHTQGDFRNAFNKIAYQEE